MIATVSSGPPMDRSLWPPLSHYTWKQITNVEIVGRALFDHNNSLSLRVLLHFPHLNTAFFNNAQLCLKAVLLHFSRNTQTHLLFLVSSLRDYLYLEPHINPPHKNVPREHLSKNYYFISVQHFRLHPVFSIPWSAASLDAWNRL